ncbi:MAG: heme ABC transporter ATP-binding protein [Aeromicrobium sp.]|uniref:heme ABC transporter ATP-binding protein n=1 Tax=Aeromicrobium sp. TaxID=1871063 RepID=UPI0026381F2D|nr:heme ABC transporter ATP-binding protein [Aeromicrobium sp.]MDF1705371.1 heme ABC transporter ATP-binding protein [Aeromicrobium sp.]
MSVACAARGVTCVRGGRPVVVDVSIDVRHGEVLALVGPNGAGKSSLLGVLAGDLAVAAGAVELGGRPIGSWRPRDLARQRSVLLQANEVSFPFRAAEVVEMGRSPWGGVAGLADDEAALATAVAQADVAHLLERPYTSLSGGERARISLARVLAQDTDVVLLDEPTAALDLRHQEEVMAVARGLARAGKAIVVVLHDLSVAAAWSDRIAIIDHGRLVACGEPEVVLTSDLVRSVYGVAVHVTRTPDGHVAVVPRRDHFSDTVSQRPDEVSYSSHQDRRRDLP